VLTVDPTVVILSGADDAHAERVERELTLLGVRSTRIGFDAFPAAATAGIRFGTTGLTRAAWTPAAGRAIDLDEVGALWWRRPAEPAGRGVSAHPAAHGLVASESATFLDDLWDLDVVPALPASRPVVRRAQLKARQLVLAGRLGFELPETLVTNDPDEALDFAASVGACRLVSKQLGFTQTVPGPRGDSFRDSFVRYTERVTTRDLAHADALRHCPMILQAEVPKSHEVRVTVVGQQVFATAVGAPGEPPDDVDYRRRHDQGVQAHLSVAHLPDDVRERCLALTAHQGLRYAAVDLVVRPDGAYVFLESNPSGQYLWTELATGQPVSAAVARELVALAHEGAR
jgi:hypothetical protein